ncbi:MAG: AmmeMemoRadiSam system protein A [Christensenellales bacterium]
MTLAGAFIVPHPPLIVPQIGRGQERKMQKTIDACKEVARRIAEIKPDTIIVTTPHSMLYADYFHLSPGAGAKGDFKNFGARDVTLEVDYDSELVETVSNLAAKEGIPAGTMGERDRRLDHGTMVPLYFINEAYKDYKLVRISLSGLSPLVHYRFGKCILKACQQTGKRAALVASGDLSHKLSDDGPYGFAEQGPVFDSKVTEIMARGDFLELLSLDEEMCEAAGECGLRSFIIMAGALDGKSVKPELLSYEGPFGVGYAVAAFTVTGDDENRHFDRIYEQKEWARLETVKTGEDIYVQLARMSLEHYVKTHKRIQCPEGLPAEITEERAGVFVSLKMDGRLRGCIGTISPTAGNIAEEIVKNAVSAGMHDPRFDPVRAEELPRLVYSVDVLGEAEPIDSTDELDVKEYGVIVTSGGRRGLLLPNLEGVDSPRQQVDIALQKAGISPGECYTMERFKVVRHK